ncbi:sulfate permease II [Neofusicoccum parvum]|nr:sulfate permease II [Neofusicoccum parvum]
MAPTRKDIGRALAKPLGIDVDYRDEPKFDDNTDTLSGSTVELFYEDEPTAKEYLSRFKPTTSGLLRYIRSLFPFWSWIFHYNLQWLTGDVVAGLTVGFVVIPQGMAYASLAELTPEYGLYTSFVGFLLYWAFATSKDITIGTVAIMSTIVGNVVVKVQEQHPDIPSEQIARGLSLVSGAILLFIGLIRAGWLVEFIPLVAINAFTTGAAISIASGQVPAMMGIRGINTRGATYLILIDILKNLGATRIDAAMGITALVFLYLLRWFCNFMSRKQPQRKKMWFFLSTLRMAFVILFYTMISWLVNRNIANEDEARFKILGTIPRGFQHAGAPVLEARMIRAFAGDLPATLIVLLIEHIAISKSFGRINNYTIDPSQELVALGFTNLFGPFLGGYPATGSFSRTAIKSKAGVRTPLAGVFTAVLVLLALYALTSVFFYIPSASIAGLIIHAVLDVVTPPAVLYKFWEVSPLEVVLFFIGVFITIFTNIENGVYAVVATSAAVLLFRHARAKGVMLGRVQIRYIAKSSLGSSHDITSKGNSPTSQQHDPPSSPPATATAEAYIPISHLDGSNPSIPTTPSPHPGIFIYKFTDGLTYVNQAHYLDHLASTLLAATRPTTPPTYARPGDRPWNDPGPPRGQQLPTTATDPRPPLRAVILDFAAVALTDVTAVQGLLDVRRQLDRHAAPDPVEWHFAGVGRRWTKRALAAAGFGGAGAGGDGDAVLFGVAACAEVVDEEGPEARDVEGGGARSSEGGETEVEGGRGRVAAVYGVDRPFFHVDVAAAVRCAVRNAERREVAAEQRVVGKEN